MRRIAPVWDDLQPDGVAGLVKTTQTASTFTVSWSGVTELNNGLHGNNFAIQMYQGVSGGAPAGTFTIYFGSTTMADGLCGISPGGLPAPAAGTVASQNWSQTPFSLEARGTIPPGAAKFQRFGYADTAGLLLDKFDMMTLGEGTPRITFVPDGSGGYTFVTGTR